MKNFPLSALALTIVSCAGHQSRAAQPPQEISTNVTAETPVARYSYLADFGFRTSKDKQAVTARAVELADLVLRGTSVESRVECAWQTSDCEGTPVHLVEPHERGSLGPCFVLPGIDAILVDAAEVDNLAELFGERDEFPVEVAPLLAVLLLHEVGHLEAEHNKTTVYALPFGSEPPNIDETEEKRIEMDADRFAGVCLRESSDMENFESWSASMDCQMAISTACFDLTAKSLIDGWAATVKQRYWDRSYTHPNFELRIMNIRHEMASDVELKRSSKEALDDFIEARSSNDTWMGMGAEFEDDPDTHSIYCLSGCGFLAETYTDEGLQIVLEAHAEQHPKHETRVE